MPLQATSGAASYDAFGGGVPVVPKYIEEYFSTFLYQGNDTTQAINNGIDLSTKGGMVWAKSRTSATDNIVWDTARGVQSRLTTNTTTAAVAGSTEFLSSFNTTGFTVTSTGSGTDPVNDALRNYVSWSWAKAPKFFDVVTYTGTGVNNRQISHNLGSAPGCVIVKATSTTGNWSVYHRGVSPINNNTLSLQSTAAASNGGQDLWGNGATVVVPTSTVFTVSNSLNTNGTTYVAYLFAHNAGGFGLTGTDNVISCGSYTGTGSTPLEINLGFEAQWVLIKRADGAVSWYMGDVMRGLANTSSGANTLQPNTSNAEQNVDFVYPTATGFAVNSTFQGFNTAGGQYIYIAIRRGPMKVPTDATKVFKPIARTGTGAIAQITGVGFPPDLAINADRTRSASANTQVTDRLRGTNVSVFTNRTDGDLTYTNAITAFGSDGETLGTDATQGAVNVSGNTYINWLFGRAPGFFDEVCYTGTGATQTIAHNLGVAPELYIVKQRSSAQGWCVGSSYIANTGKLALQTTAEVFTDSTAWNSTYPTSSVLTVGSLANTNENAKNFVAYLFASAPGVSKVGSYTGNGTTQTINCGFTGGARFVLIKATSTTGNWLVWDSARGIVAGNDPYLALNSTAAEVTTTDWVDTAATGFELSNAGGNLANSSGVSYIFWAVA